MLFVDYDLDGSLDLLTANGHIEDEINKVQASQQYAQPPQLFWNAADCGRRRRSCPCRWPETGDLGRPMVGRGSAFADIDGDGDLDLVLTAVAGAAAAAAERSALRSSLDAASTWSARKAIATRLARLVEVRVAGRTIRRWVMPTRSYLSQSERTVTIGLGPATAVDSVTFAGPGASSRRQPRRRGPVSSTVAATTTGFELC